MKHLRLISAIAALSIIFPMMARTTAAQAFADAPKGIFMLLDKNARLDMIDYFRSGSKTATANSLAGNSRITALSDDVMDIEMTKSSNYQLVMLRGNSDSDDVIALIITVATPAKDSRIEFYSAADWKPIASGKLMPEPDLKTWLTDEGRRNQDFVEGMVPFIMASYSYDDATKTLTLTNDLSTFLSPDIYDMVKGYMRDSLTYTWNGKKMVLRK